MTRATQESYINLVTDDTLADEFRPNADLQLIENSVTDEYVSLEGSKTVGRHRLANLSKVRLTDSGDINLSFRFFSKL